MAERVREFTLEIFDSFEEADEANRQKLRAMTGVERITLLFQIDGKPKGTRAERFPGTYEISDVPLPDQAILSSPSPNTENAAQS